MYKAFHTKKYYLAFNTFPVTAKNIHTEHGSVYLSGIRCWDASDMKYYTLVIYRFRVMFGIKKIVGECACGFSK
jgi:hypothetical protein